MRARLSIVAARSKAYILKRLHPGPEQLLLLGQGAYRPPGRPDVLAPGFVDAQTKQAAVSACDMVVVPSRLESLSLLALEAMAHAKPILANRACQVLLGHCRRSQGGLHYSRPLELAEQMHLLFSNPQVRSNLGDSGRRYVAANYSWAVVLDRFEAAMKALVVADV